MPFSCVKICCAADAAVRIEGLNACLSVYMLLLGVLHPSFADVTEPQAFLRSEMCCTAHPAVSLWV